MRRLITLSLLALAACDDKDTSSDDTDTETVESDTVDTDGVDSDTDLGPTTVLHDCEPVVGNICPYAGTSENGFNGDGHDKLDTWFSYPTSILIEAGKPPVIADWNNQRLRVIDEDGTLRTIMGTGFPGDGDYALKDGTAEGADGTDVNLNHPTQQVWLPDGVLLSTSWHAHKLRTWDPVTGKVHVVLGKGSGWNEPPVDEEHPPGLAYPQAGVLLNQPVWSLVDSDGNVWIADMRNERIRLWDRTAETVRTVIGSGAKAVFGTGVCTSDDALATCLNLPKSGNPVPGGSIAFDEDESHLFLSDSESHVIRVWDRETDKVTVLAGAPGEAGDVDDVGGAARFHYPFGLAYEAATHTLFVADAYNHKIRAVDTTTGAVTTVVGTGEPTCPSDDVLVPEQCGEQFRSGDGGPALDARLYSPFAVTLDPDGNLVITDTNNHRFRIVYR
jgi:DNA-binding beta-propeller fold protein YncE